LKNYFVDQKANPQAAAAPSPINITIRAALFCILIGSWMLFVRPLGAQAPAPALEAQSHLTLVHGVVEQEDKQTHGINLLNNLAKTDFRLFDNNREVAIQTFGAGADLSSPIALWLVVQCNLGPPDDETSGFMRGKTQYLKPALEHLNGDDLVGVAHWCDDGQGIVDVPLGTSVEAALQGIDTVLAGKTYINPDTRGSIGLQKMIQLIVKSTQAATPARWPVMLFLDGDRRDTTENRLANTALASFTATSGMVFGMGIGTRDQSPIESMRNGGEILNLVHNYSGRTGGQYYTTPSPESFGQILDYILTQTHLCYTLGFEPPKLDSKTHDLRVELTKDAQKRFPKTTPRFRTEYIPLPPAQ
jgi:hypothetical protein